MTATVTVPLGVVILTAAIDVHKNRLEALWVGWGRGEQSWGIDHVVLPGEVQDDSLWTELGTELRRQFDHALGCKIGLRFGLVDGGKWPDWVYKFMRRLAGTAAFPGDPLPGSPVRGKIRACRGWGGPLHKGGVHPIVNFKYSTSLAKNLGGHWVGTDAAKDLIYTRARLEPNLSGGVGSADFDRGRVEPKNKAHAISPAQSFPDGYIHLSERFDEEFVKQMFAERVTVKYVGGREIRTFENKPGVRNEALDLFVYNLAAYRLLRLTDQRLDAIEKELVKAAEDAKKLTHGEDRQSISSRRKARRKRASGWMNWRN